MKPAACTLVANSCSGRQTAMHWLANTNATPSVTSHLALSPESPGAPQASLALPCSLTHKLEQRGERCAPPHATLETCATAITLHPPPHLGRLWMHLQAHLASACATHRPQVPDRGTQVVAPRNPADPTAQHPPSQTHVAHQQPPRPCTPFPRWALQPFPATRHTHGVPMSAMHGVPACAA